MGIGAGNSGSSVSSPETIGLGRLRRPFGGGRTMSPSLCMANTATRAITSLSPPWGLNPPMHRQNSFDSAWQFSGSGPAISARSSAISSAVKSRPQSRHCAVMAAGTGLLAAPALQARCWCLAVAPPAYIPNGERPYR